MEKNITAEYIPDGQFYRALLVEDEVAEFNLTSLIRQFTYRVLRHAVAPVMAILFSACTI
ncbi:MAG: hypothetical protein IPO60_08225 [Flavobacteriales bacterium]|nr:hypothetical protein [Flavobacteriales bacterium]